MNGLNQSIESTKFHSLCDIVLCHFWALSYLHSNYESMQVVFKAFQVRDIEDYFAVILQKDPFLPIENTTNNMETIYVP